MENPDVLSVGEGPGIASGIGIALFDSRGQQLLLNRPADRWISLYRGPTTLNFVAKYRATGRRVTGGAANARARVLIDLSVINPQTNRTTR